MKAEVSRELEYLRLGFLTFYILKIVEGLPKVDMQPYYALILQEMENKNRLGAGKSLIFSRLKYLRKNGFISSRLGTSSNPRAKKPVSFFKITDSGRSLLKELEREQKRIISSMAIYG